MGSVRYDTGTLEFPLFCDTIRRTFISSFASAKVGVMRPFAHMDDIKKFQNKLKNVFGLFNTPNPPPIQNDNKFFLFYQKVTAQELPFLSVDAEEYVTIKEHIFQMLALKKYLEDRAKFLTELEDTIGRLRPDGDFAETLERTFEDGGELKDGASDELRHIRRKLREVKRHIQAVLQDTFNKPNADKFIQESVVVLRNGRYTIPCKTNFAQYIQGIIHDRSASGQTVYVEPTSCVAVNNNMQDTILAESAEIARILAALLQRFNQGLPALHETIKSYSELTFLLCLAGFYRDYDTVFPEFGDNVTLRDVHHPLLRINKGKNSVPIDINLSKDERLIVVSGPNTGGKTASLKSMGLNHIIAMCGLPIMAKRADMIFFSDIRADIGDNQSLVMDLSTFSSHMTNIKNIIGDVGKRALVLFDELGTGTDPKEGASLALSVLDYLGKNNTTVMITTHFSELKAYAFERADAKLYSVDFNYDTYEPTYRLLEGVAGKSDPILIAKRLGFPKIVTDRADEYIKSIKSRSDVAWEEINMLRAEAEHTKRILAEKGEELALKKQKLDDAEKNLNEKLSKRELQLLEETYALLQKGKRLADERTKRSAEDIADDIKSVEEKIVAVKSKQKPISELKEGDIIFLERYGKVGKILSLEKDKAHIDLEGLKVKIDRRDIIGRKIENDKPKKVNVAVSKSSESRGEIILVGKRVEEALDILDKYLDESGLSGYDKIYIVHGRGSGQLRRAVQDFLRTSGRIKDYRTATAEEGGNAITVVTL